MPLIEIRQLTPQTRLGLWRMEDAAEKPRQRERQAEQELLLAMTGDSQLSIGHEPSGKPVLNAPLLISISHTRGYVSMLLSSGERVGVDIEFRSDRVERIASRFIRPDEQAPTVMDKLLLWSAKETVYKLFSEDRLMFFDMQTLSIGNHVLRMQNLKQNKVVDVYYEFTDDYVLTYATAPL